MITASKDILEKSYVEINRELDDLFSRHHFTPSSGRNFSDCHLGIKSARVDDLEFSLDDFGSSSTAFPFASHSELVGKFFANEFRRKLRPFDAKKPSQKAEESALHGWLAAESKCSLTNDLFFSREIEKQSHYRDLCNAKALIKRVLSSRPDLDEVCNSSWFGPGSTLSTEQGKTGAHYKAFDLPLQVSPLLYDDKALLYKLVWKNRQWRRALLQHRTLSDRRSSLFDRYSQIRSSYEAFEFYYPVLFESIEYGRWTSVFKDIGKSRPIVIGANLNVFIQKGIGTSIKRLLEKGTGIEISSWQQYHKVLVGQFPGLISTIDLSAASDSVSCGLVEFLLPAEWYNLLLEVRPEFTLLPDGTLHLNEGISGMGCGFTFELETLIFWALSTVASTVTSILPHAGSFFEFRSRNQSDLVEGLRASVYGDDIVVLVRDFDRVVSLLSQCGFEINYSKSFTGTQALRESCGCFSFNGETFPVFNCKELNTLADYEVTHNRLCLLYDKYAGSSSSDLVSLLKEMIRIFRVHCARVGCFEGPRGAGGTFWVDEYYPTKAVIVACLKREKRQLAHIKKSQESVLSRFDTIYVDSNGVSSLQWYWNAPSYVTTEREERVFVKCTDVIVKEYRFPDSIRFLVNLHNSKDTPVTRRSHSVSHKTKFLVTTKAELSYRYDQELLAV